MNRIINQTIVAAHFILIALVFSTVNAAAQPGAIDPAFNGGAFDQPRGFVYAVARQPTDGKYLIGGTYSVANGFARNGLARLEVDGSVDQSFNASAIMFGTYNVIVPLADGKILVGGIIYLTNGNAQVLVRLNADGSLDNTFQYLNGGTSGTVYDLGLLPDGKIVIAGSFNYSQNGNFRSNIARLNADGTLDSTFNPNTSNTVFQDVEVQADGKIVGGITAVGSSNKFLKRYNQDGSEDTTFNALFTNPPNSSNVSITALKIQPDGKFLVGGTFSFVNNTARINFVRLNADGSPDESLTSASVPIYGINDIELDSVTGKIIVTGQNSAPGVGDPSKTLVRLEMNGAQDASFTFRTDLALPIYIGYDALPLPDGKVLLAGYKANSIVSGGTVVRVNQDGTIDQTFKVLTGVVGSISEIAPQPDGKVLVAGTFNALNNHEQRNFGRFNFDGTPDTTFIPALVSNSPSVTYDISAVAVQPDGKILVGGNFNGNFVRLNSDGSRDTTFSVGSSFQPLDIAIQPDGKIVAVGGSGTNSVVRLNSDGSRDTSFANVTTNAAVLKVIIQPDGKILIGGGFGIVNIFARGGVARLNADATLDTTFNPLGGVSGGIFDIGLQPDGKVVIVGTFNNVNGTTRNYIARLNSNGSLDTAFAPTLLNGYPFAVEIQPDGKIIIGGNFTIVNNALRSRIARLNADGSNDNTFQTGTGANGIVNALALTSNLKIYVGGNFSAFNNVGKVSIVRLQNDSAGRTIFDYDGDGRADLSVFRPSTGFWYQLNIQTAAFSARQFGASTDLIAPADYEGDGRTDIAVFRPGAFAYFYIFDSSTNAFRFSQFGTTGDVPLSGDWDGDGRADLAVYRAATTAGGVSNFYYRPSSQPAVDYITIAFGTAGDKPLYGDFDGDGRLDAAVFRAADASWRILQSSNNQTTVTTFGVSTDIPVPSDYDGDGRTNIAVFRPSTGTWYTSQNPATNYGAIQFGANGDVPVAADYDGDGRADAAVFRPSNGGWYLNRTTSGFTGVQFGTAEDKPIPNAFIR